jgi:hypothetical protein
MTRASRGSPAISARSWEEVDRRALVGIGLEGLGFCSALDEYLALTRDLADPLALQ